MNLPVDSQQNKVRGRRSDCQRRMFVRCQGAERYKEKTQKPKHGRDLLRNHTKSQATIYCSAWPAPKSKSVEDQLRRLRRIPRGANLNAKPELVRPLDRAPARSQNL